MKQIIAFLSVAVFLMTACKKDKENILNTDGTVDIQKISLLTIEPAFRADQSIRTGGKTSIDLSKHSYLEFGICFGEDPSPTINDNIVFSTVSSNGEYESVIDKKYVKEGVTLYVRAYIKDLNKNTIKYGNETKAEKEYVPVNGVPVDVTRIYLTTHTPTVGEYNTVTISAKASLDLNKYEELVYGICYGTNPEPTVDDNIVNAEISTNGEFSVRIDDLKVSTSQTIYFRAYIINAKNYNQKYGNVVSVKLEPSTFDTRLLNGTFRGVHKFTNIPEAMLKSLSQQLPPDENGNPVDLSAGFLDTLIVRMIGNRIELYSELLGVTLDGQLTGSNRFSIPEKFFPLLKLGESVDAKNVRVKTAQDVIITSNALGTSVNIRLSLSATEVAGITIPLTILTSGDFVKVE